MRVRELRAVYQPVASSTNGRRILSTPADAAALFLSQLAGEAQEVFLIACLDIKHQLIAVSEISRGALDQTVVHPREVFKIALLANAGAIVTAHNHPSGIVTPSGPNCQHHEVYGMEELRVRGEIEFI